MKQVFHNMDCGPWTRDRGPRQTGNKKRPGRRTRSFFGENKCCGVLQAGVDGREDVTNQRTHDGDGGDNDHGHKHQDQRVLYHALSFFLESEFHDNNLLVDEWYIQVDVFEFDGYILSKISHFSTNKDVR